MAKQNHQNQNNKESKPSEEITDQSRLLEFGRLLPREETSPMVGRERELMLLLRHVQTNRQSVLIVGPSGCGKTSLIKAVARKLEGGVLETATVQMLVGTRYLGEFETRAKHFVDLCLKTSTAIYFTDMWSLHRTGRSSNSDKNVGSFVTPHMARGELVLLGECTEEQYRSAVEDDRTFGTNFQVIRLGEASESQCAEMLAANVENRVTKLLANQQLTIEIDESVKRRILEESRVAFPSVAAPGRTIRLLDALISEEIEPAIKSGQPDGKIVVRPQTILRVVEKLTGMSLRLLDESQPLRSEEVRSWFDTRILGQPEAVKAVVDLVMIIKSGLTRGDRPMAVMLFVGPTGVGKTELARRLAEYVFGSDSRLARFDMAEFQDASAVPRLAGAPWYTDPTAREGLLASKARNQPFSVILFDEIEKAHYSVHQMLLGVFGSGRLTDPQGQTTDFTRSIFIMTSNLGSDLGAHRSFGLKASEFNLREKVDESIAGFFSPEFRGRVSRFVLFQPLQLPELRILAQREIGKILLERGIRRRNVHLEIDPAVYDHVLATVSTDPLGARVLAARVEEQVVLPLSHRLAEIAPSESGNIVRLAVKNGNIVANLVRPAEDSSPRRRGGELVPARAVRIAGDGLSHPVKLTKQRLDRLLADLQGQVNYLREICQQNQIDQQKTALLGKTLHANFWDAPVAAKAVLSEIHRLDSKQAVVDGIGEELNELQFMNRGSTLPSSQIEAIGRRAMTLQKRVSLANYALRFLHAPQRCQAFVDIRLIGRETLKENPAARIAGMYAAWARSYQLPLTVLHEDIQGDATRQVILLIESLAIAGILAGERGLHELFLPPKARQSSASAFVEVEVFPRLEELPLLPSHHLVCSKTQGRGRLAPVTRSITRIECDELTQTVVLKSELNPPQAKSLAIEYLATRLSRHHEPPAARTDDRPIRRYTLGSGGGVKDYQTGFTRGGLNGLWHGQIDDLLHASLATRTPTVEPVVSDEPIARETQHGNGVAEARGD